MVKDSFIFYRSFYEAIIELDEHSRWLIIDAICKKALYGEETQFSGLLKMVYTLINPVLESNQKKAEGGKKGGRPRKTNGLNNDENQESIGFENAENEKTIGFKNKKTIGFENEKPIPSNDNSNEQEQEEEQEEEEDKDVDVDNDFEKESVEKNAADKSATPTLENDFSANSTENPASPEKEKGCAEKEKTIDERAAEFWKMIEPYKGSYGCEMLQAFYGYWTEHNANGRKMRFEMEKVFDIPRRLATWASNENKFGRKPAPQKTSSLSVNDIWKK